MTVEHRSSGPRAMGNRRRRFPHEPADRRWYGVRAGYQTGPIQGWQNCLRSVRGYEQAEYQRCLDREDAQRWCDSNPQPRPTTPLSETGSFASPINLFANEANSFSIASGSGGLFSPSTGSSSDSGGSFSGRTNSPDQSLLNDRLRTERAITALRQLLRDLDIGETVSITRSEGDFDFMYTIGSLPRSLD